ncbi:MAG: toxin TcdB middle/N-terminal domain-containing protein, partial [Kofleriaceae bacterium]
MYTRLVRSGLGVLVLTWATLARGTPYESGGKVDPYFGAYTEDVPIVVPAYHGLEPRLSISYNSSAGNGVVGVGWSLRGLSVIEMTNIGAGAATELTYALDGEPLVACDRQTDRDSAGVAQSPSCEPGAVPSPSQAVVTGYSTMSESYVKIQHEVSILPGTDRWHVWLKNGTHAIYEPSDAWTYDDLHVKYVITSVTDTSVAGNTVTYDWHTRSAGYAFTQLAAIRYNGALVTFHYTPRALAETLAGGQGLDTIDQQLTTIDVCVLAPGQTACAASDPHRARAYSFDYKQSAGTSRPLLTSLTTWGSDAVLDPAGKVLSGHALPILSFGWNDAAPTFDTVMITPITDWGDATTQGMVDWNGDGNIDFCRSTSKGDLACAFGNGTGWGISSGERTIVGRPNGWGDNDSRAYIDWDGDGKMDFCRIDGTGIFCASSTGAGLADGQVLSTTGVGPLGDAGVAGERWFTDWNGDGKGDFCRLVHVGKFATEMWCAFSRGRGVYEDHEVGALAIVDNATGNPATRAMTDWNGDGKADFCRLVDATVMCLLAAVDPLDRNNLTRQASDVALGSVALIGLADAVHWIDVNGDGKADYCRGVGGGEIDCALSTGLGLHDVVWTTGDTGVDASRKWGDLNGDGKMDVCRGDGANATCTISVGLTGVPSGSAVLPMWESRHWMVDWNGDGRAEYCSNTGSYGGAGSFLTCLRRSPTALGDLVTTFSNGIGGVTTVSYTPSSTWTASTQPANNNPPILPTVTQVVTDGGPPTVYQYSGGQYDAFSRRFLGFGWVRVTDPCLPGEGTACPFSELTYRIDPRYPTRLAGSYRYGGSLGALQQVTLSSYADTPAIPYRSDAVGETVFLYDVGGVNLTLVLRRYDRYGNVTRVEDHGLYADGVSQLPALTSDDRALDTEYAVNRELYVVDKPGRMVGWNGVTTSAARVTETQFLYDGATAWSTPPVRGAVTTTRRWLDTANSFVESFATYDDWANLVTETDARGGVTRYDLDPIYHQYLEKLTRPAAGAIASSISSPLADWSLACGAKTRETDDRNGTATSYTYDPLCRRTRTDLPGGGYERISYHDLGLAGLQYTEVAGPGPQGDVWARTYFDGRGRTTRLTRRGPDADNDVIAAEYTYNARGHVASRGRPRYALDASAPREDVSYDNRDRVIRVALPGGGAKTTSYGLRTAVVNDELGHQQVTQVDVRGRTLMTATSINNSTLGDIVYRSYDGNGKLAQLQQLQQHGAVWATWTFSYDSLGRQIAAFDPDTGARASAYDASGNLVDDTDANGSRTHYTYDALDRRTSKTIGYCPRRCFGPQPVTVTWTYDEARPGHANIGRLTSMTDPSGTASYDYDAAGHLVQGGRTVDGVSYPFAKQYDLAGRLLATSYPDGSTLGSAAQPLGYDAAGRLTTIPGFIDGATYDAAGELTSYLAENSAATHFDHDPVTGQLSGYGTIGPATSSLDGTMQLGSYARSATADATQSYETLAIASPYLTLVAGQTLTASTCGAGVVGATGAGDTVLRLFSPSGVEVASNDNAGGACGALSTVAYTVPTGGGIYTVHAGCKGASACKATVAVQIKNPMTNLALGRPVTMSSVFDPSCGPSAAAVDGNTAGTWCSASSMAHSQLEYQPWLSIDLGNNGLDKVVDHIDIWNRSDALCDVACRDRLRNFDVYVYDANSNSIRSFYIPDQAGYPTRIDVGGSATAVSIRLRDTNYLHTPEVQVFGRTPLILWSQAVVHAVHITRDAEQRIVQIVSNRPDESWSYGYSPDGLHQLTSATDDYDSTGSQTYAYDPNGNMTLGPAGLYTYPTGANPAHPHAVTSVAGVTVSYDANGQQLATTAGATFTWDAGGRMTSSTDSTGSVAYAYDAEGQRLKKTFQGTTTV